MRKIGKALLLGCCLLTAEAQTQKELAPPMPKVKIGDVAPDFADQIGVNFALFGDIGGKGSTEYGPYKEYNKFNTKIPAARRATYLIDTNGRVVEMQIDAEAVDPTDTVTLCERRKLKA